MVAKFEEARVPMSWSVGPLDRPNDLAGQLLSNGFRLEESVPVMVLELRSLRTPERPHDLTIRHVADLDELRKWVRLWVEVYQIPKAARKQFEHLFIRKETSVDSDTINYLGLMGRRLVGIATLLLGKRAARIYNIGTAPAARGKGIGIAMTVFALAEASRLGCELATLQTSKAGYGIYKGPGFEECFRLSTYVRTE